jgi:hypothetical protein
MFRPLSHFRICTPIQKIKCKTVEVILLRSEIAVLSHVYICVYVTYVYICVYVTYVYICVYVTYVYICVYVTYVYIRYYNICKSDIKIISF